jgi:hypothetical protein
MLAPITGSLSFIPAGPTLARARSSAIRDQFSEAHVMQAAVVSVLLMAGVCGAPPSQCGCENSQGVVQQGYDGTAGGGTMGCGTAHDRTLWSPVTPDGTVTYDRGLFGRSLFSPLWLIHGNATFYPGNYAKPYDYREAFGYPWNGPRPLAPMPAAAMPEPMPQASTANPWPAATRATYLQQTQPRVASKPALATP